MVQVVSGALDPAELLLDEFGLDVELEDSGMHFADWTLPREIFHVLCSLSTKLFDFIGQTLELVSEHEGSPEVDGICVHLDDGVFYLEAVYVAGHPQYETVALAG